MSTEAEAALSAPRELPKPVQSLRRQVLNPWLLKLFFFGSLPMALFAGLRVRSLDRHRCATTVPYGWRTKNPFRSTYFAAQSMAAELSTGALGMLAVRAAPQPVAMLIVNLEAQFEKKATSRVTFTCEDGEAIFQAVEDTSRDGEPRTVHATTVGTTADGTVVSRFVFTWSFKRR